MKEEEDTELARPPYFKSWRSIYVLVLTLLLLIILLLHLFSVSFS